MRGTRTPISEARFGTTAARSYLSENLVEAYCGTYDVLICVSGWDERSVCILGAEQIRAREAWLLTFEEKDETGYRERNDAALLGFLPAVADEVIQVSPSSRQVEESWQELRRRLLLEYYAANRALRIGIDSSVCPRYITLALLGLVVNGPIAAQLDIFYAEGWYPAKPELADISFTTGSWRTVHVSGMEGLYRPTSSRYYMISLGFEGHKTLRVVNTADPERVSVLLPDPGTHPEYAARTLQDNADLLTAYNVPPEQIVRAPAGDAVGAWKALADARLERFDQENVHYLCSGTKAHSIALGLRALTSPGGAVLYNVPERYSPIIVKPSGKYWKYCVYNLGVPESAPAIAASGPQSPTPGLSNS